MKPAISAAAALAAIFLAAHAEAQQVKPSCTDVSRACMITAATSYFDALVSHDASKALFAPDVRRTELGHVTGQGEAQIREHTKTQPDMTRSNTRFFVDDQTHNVIGMTVLHIVPDTAKADQTRKSIPVTEPRTGHLIERFKVEGGLIEEIEAIFYLERGKMDGISGWSDKLGPRPAGDRAPQVKPPCTDNSRTCLIGAAASYLDNLVKADGSKTLFASNVRRTVQARELVGEAKLRENLNSEPKIDGHHSTRYFVDRQQGTVIAYTLLPVPPGQDAPTPQTTHLAERYTMVNGLITEIEGIFYNEPGGRMVSRAGRTPRPDARHN